MDLLQMEWELLDKRMKHPECFVQWVGGPRVDIRWKSKQYKMKIVEMVKLRERGENGMTTFALPEEWMDAEVLVNAFATTLAGRRTSRTLSINVE